MHGLSTSRTQHTPAPWAPRTPTILPSRPQGLTRPLLIEERGGDDGNLRSRYQAINNRVAQEAWDILNGHYPGHYWVTRADIKQGICQVKLISFSDWSEVIHLQPYPTHTAFTHAVMIAGGKWLERFGFERRGLDVDVYRNAMVKHRPNDTRHLKPAD